jgi:hypothetical protein
MSGRHRACPICGGHLGVETRYSSAGLEVVQIERCSNGDCPYGDQEQPPDHEQPPWHGRYQAQEQATARSREIRDSAG